MDGQKEAEEIKVLQKDLPRSYRLQPRKTNKQTHKPVFFHRYSNGAGRTQAPARAQGLQQAGCARSTPRPLRLPPSPPGSQRGAGVTWSSGVSACRVLTKQ